MPDSILPMDEESPSGSSSQETTPPPSYTETETSNRHGQQQGAFISSSRQTTVLPPPQVKRTSKGLHKEEKVQNTDFVKGLIPMTMAARDPDEDTLNSDEYDIDSDPLLQDAPRSSNSMVGVLQDYAAEWYQKNHVLIWRIVWSCVLVAYTFYLGFAVAYSPYGAIAPLTFTGLAVLYFFVGAINKNYGKEIRVNFVRPVGDWWDRHWETLKWFVSALPVLGLIVYVCLMITEMRQLQSLSGFVFFFCVIWLTSKHPDKVTWRPVVWGYTLQFVMAILVLQWDKGYAAVEWLSDYVTKVINFGYQGAAVIYGDPMLILHPFVMMGLSLLIYIGAVLAILYYFGLTQYVASRVAYGLSAVMGTTAIETLAVSANILLNGMDVMLMLRPYLDKLTISEFNCFQVGSTSTIAGFMFGILILYGAPPEHLLTAAVMSAPATIAISKLHYPETTPEKSVTKEMKDIRMSRGADRNLFEAAANGSSVAGKTVLTVMANYISFMSMLEFLDAGLSWFGNRVGYPEVSFEWICSYLFFPVALLVGIDVGQCRQIAKVIGLKVFTTEIYAYQVLGQTYDDGLIDERSKALGTYAMCGFCSLSTIAIAVGTWQVVCPQRRRLVTKLMFRTLLQANISCFTTACVAGLFYSEKLSIFDNARSSPLRDLAVWLFDQRRKIFD